MFSKFRFVGINLFKAMKTHKLNAHHLQHPSHHFSPQFPHSLSSKWPFSGTPQNRAPPNFASTATVLPSHRTRLSPTVQGLIWAFKGSSGHLQSTLFWAYDDRKQVRGSYLSPSIKKHLICQQQQSALSIG